MSATAVTPLVARRPSGLPGSGTLPWGAHVCQFFRTRQDLLETLVPYFRAGLLANERCIWITGQPFASGDAREALAGVVPDLDERMRRGQIEIRDHDDWYLQGGEPTSDAVLESWLEAEASAHAAGYDGLRISGNISFVEASQWSTFAAYEQAVHRAFQGRKIVALCSYTLDDGDSHHIVDVLENHESALVRHRGSWEWLESATAVLEQQCDELREAERRARVRLQLIVDAARHIAHAKLDLRQVLDAVVREVTRSGFASCCAVSLMAKDGETLEPAALFDVDERRVAELEAAVRPRPVAVGAGIMGGVAATGLSVRLTDPAAVIEQADPDCRAKVERDGIATIVAVPLRASSEVIGVLVVSRRAPCAPFSEDDEQLLQDLADRAALSVENALLYQRAKAERDRAEQERRRAEGASRAKDEFLAMLGHELRNPLSPILTAVQLMRLRAGDQLLKERTIIERQVNHMVRLVDDLLDVSRIARGKVELRRTAVELARVVANAIEIASPLLEQRAQQLVASVPASGLLVHADPDRLAQVIVNLLTNAAKYTPIKGVIEIGAVVRDGKVALSVRDSGIGIEPELLDRIFEVFVQAGQERDRARGGLGLGLAIARNLVDMHDGVLHAQSDGPGEGSTFTVELPLLAGAKPSFGSRRSFHPKRAADSRLRILVVDDNVDAAAVLGEVLVELGHEVRIAHDGPAALELVPDFRPELALLDIGLPVMDGFEVAQRIVAMTGGNCPKLVAVTGYGQARDRHESMAAGFHDHVVKPVDLERLVTMLGVLFPAAALA